MAAEAASELAEQLVADLVIFATPLVLLTIGGRRQQRGLNPNRWYTAGAVWGAFALLVLVANAQR